MGEKNCLSVGCWSFLGVVGVGGRGASDGLARSRLVGRGGEEGGGTSRRSISSQTPKTRNSPIQPTTGTSRCKKVLASARQREQWRSERERGGRTTRPVSRSVSTHAAVLRMRRAHHSSLPCTSTLTSSMGPMTSRSILAWTARPRSRTPSRLTVRAVSTAMVAPEADVMVAGRASGGRWGLVRRRYECCHSHHEGPVRSETLRAPQPRDLRKRSLQVGECVSARLASRRAGRRRRRRRRATHHRLCLACAWTSSASSRGSTPCC